MSVTPNENDVLLGRGHFVNNYPGNLRFRRIADEQKPHYIATSKRKEKQSIALDVIMEVQSSDPPGRFLMDTSGSKISVLSDGVWEVASQEKALHKVLHRMREKDRGDCVINAEKGAREKESVAQSSADDGFPWIHNSDSESQLEGGTSKSSSPVELLGPTKIHCTNFEDKRCISKHSDEIELQHNDSSKLRDHDPTSSLPQATISKAQNADDTVYSRFSSADIDDPSDNISDISSSHLDGNDNSVVDGSNIANFRQRAGSEHLDDIPGIYPSNIDFDTISTQMSREYSLVQWINENRPKQSTSGTKGTNDESSKPLFAYVNSALLVASKVAEYLMLADQMQRLGSPNTAPLASIKTSNIVIGVKRKQQTFHKHDTAEVPPVGTDLAGIFDVDSRHTEEHEDNPEKKSTDIVIDEIVHVKMDCPLEIDSGLGSVADRLVALGVVFVELFSFGNRIIDYEESNGINSTLNSTTLGNMNLNRTNPIYTTMHPRKKHSCEEMNSPSTIVAELALLGIPHALCALVEDLLECNQGEFLRDDAYRSFEDVYSDLQLMIKEPSKFLYDNGGPQLVMSDKLYGREDEIKRIQEAYTQRADGDCVGVVISGESGVGKSRLAKNAGELNRANNNGTFLGGKFDQIQYSQPLSVIATVFDDMCRLIAEDVRFQGAKEIAALCLEKALGSQALLLSKFLPSLSNLITLDSTQSTVSYCTDSAESVRFLFCKTVEILSSYSSGPVTIFLDDVQWADPASLLLISSLLQCSKENKRVFFLLCVRGNEIQDSPDSPVHNWYQSTFEMPMKHITLANLSEEGVNAMISDTLGLFPRLTRPLSKVLHRKALGNPFFVWQILETLQKEGYFYHSLRGTMRRWMWDMDRISDLKISENVLSLLMREMNKLPNDLKMGLEVASCMGATVSMTVVDILSSHLKVDLAGILERVLEKGFVDRVGTEEYRFVHDRVQQAAYEMMTEHRRRENHMAFGLAICSESMNKGNDELMFTAVNQINRGGPGVLRDFRQKSVISALNLKVGRRSATLTDFAYAYFCFKNGISFLNEEYWTHQYRLSIDLHDAAADAACALSDITGVQNYSQAVLSHAASLEDKLNAMFTIVKSLRMTLSLAEAEIYAVRFLLELGEEEPRMNGNPQLDSDISSMIVIVSSKTDDQILNLKQSQDKKLSMLMNLYHEFFYIFQMMDPSRLSSVSLRMVQLSLECGITELSPLAFAQFGVVVLSGGNAIVGYRMGSLALKLARNLCAPRLISSVIAVVQPYLAWVAEPLQTITESHQHGHTLGAQCGDVSSSTLNYAWFCMAKLLSGGDLEVVRRESGRFLKELRSKKQNWGFLCASITYLLSVALIDGPNSDLLVGNCDLPSETDIFAFAIERKHELISFGIRTHRLIRNFLFRQYDEMSNSSSFLSYLLERNPPLHSLFIIGVFYEGLTSYCIARRTRHDIWTTRGNAALTFIQHWSHSSQWNFQNKELLLQAEKSFTLGNLTEAQNFYKEAITAARRHKFIHEEGLSHELSGLFFLDSGLRDEALEELLHSVRCFRTWGAYAVADRVNSLIGDNGDES